MTDERDYQGRFAVGNQGGPGRPKRATEAEHFQALRRVVSVADLVAIARRAVADAKKGNARARDWVSKYLLNDLALKALLDTSDRKRVSEAVFQAIREKRSKAQVAAGPTVENCFRELAPGSHEAPAPHGLATPFRSEENL